MKEMQICDQLVAIREKVVYAKVVNMELNEFPASWEPFFKGICSHENLHKFGRL
jgi:hypothetical protein